MLRFSLKCQSGFLAVLILAILLGPMVALAATSPAAADAATTPAEPATTEETESSSDVAELPIIDETENSPDIAELPPVAETESLPVLPPVIVIGKPEIAATGRSKLSQQEIERLPARNGSVNELLLVLPGIQASDSANLSTQAGEIAPPALSISGGKTYQNNFQVDGQGTNLILDPLNTTTPGNVSYIPSSSQSLWLDPRLIKEVTVLDHNVSARYGEFAGGVVDVQTRDPQEYFSGNLFYRTTSDAWTKFQVENQTVFEKSNSDAAQPRFEKYNAGASFDLPITETAGVLLAVQKQNSRIPLTYFGGDKDERRQRESYFLKFVNKKSEQEGIALSFISTPSRGEYFMKDTLRSDFTLKTTAQMLAADYRHNVGSFNLELRGSYAITEATRTAPLDFKKWLLSVSKPWGVLGSDPKTKNSLEGGFGPLETRQKTLQLSATVETDLVGQQINQQILTGVDYVGISGEYQRPATSYYYLFPKALTSLQGCGDDTETCVAGEQYFSQRNIYEEDEASARLNRVSVYVEDRINWGGKVEFRPGVRISHDDYMQNTDIAPRFNTTFDLFGDQTTRLIAGANRYYSETLLAGKLREAIQPWYKQTRSVSGTTLTPWSAPVLTTKTANRYSELKTPYVDELSTGIDQALAGGRLALDYIYRKGKDQFALELGPLEADQLRYNVLTNQGRTQYESWRLGWQRSWARHEILANLTWQQTRSNAENYLDRLDDETLDQQVYYHGEFKEKRYLPSGRNDYNQAWIGNLVYTGRLPAGFEFTNVTRYRSGYQVVMDTGTTKADTTGTKYPVYDEVKVSGSWLFDWVWAWRHALTQHQELSLSLEVYNVFDRKVRAGISEDEYELGRQIWAGAEYRF